MIPARGRYSPKDIQVLSPMHRGEAGVAALNVLLQERLNPGRPGLPEIRSGGRVFRPGDRVLHIDDGQGIRYPSSSLYSLAHAFAISVHKAQGAEFPAVVLPLVTNHAAILGRTLLYTAVTRAKQVVVIVGQRKALGLAVRDWRTKPRHTALAGVLEGTLRFTWSRTQRRETAGVEPDWDGLLAGGEGV